MGRKKDADYQAVDREDIEVAGTHQTGEGGRSLVNANSVVNADSVAERTEAVRGRDQQHPQGPSPVVRSELSEADQTSSQEQHQGLTGIWAHLFRDLSRNEVILIVPATGVDNVVVVLAPAVVLVVNIDTSSTSTSNRSK